MAQIGGVTINNPSVINSGAAGNGYPSNLSPQAKSIPAMGLPSGFGVKTDNTPPTNQQQTPGSGSTTTTTTNQNGNGVGGNQLNAPLYVQGIQQEYGAVLNNAPTAQNILNTQEGALEGQYQHGADVAIANAQQQNAGNQAVLQSQIEGTQKGQALSLSELANTIRSQYQGLGAQLGAAGAGSSSAREMGARGLAEEQNTQRANIEQQAGSNIANLQTQQKAQQADTDTLIQGYRKTATDQIATVKANYAQLMNQLSVALDQAQGEEKARLAEFGQTLTDAAKQSLASIEAELNTKTNSLLTQGVSKLNEGSLPAVQNVNPITYTAPNPNTASTAVGTNATSPGLLPYLKNEANQPITA